MSDRPIDPRLDDPQESEGPADWRTPRPRRSLRERYFAQDPVKRGRLEGMTATCAVFSIICLAAIVIRSQQERQAQKPAQPAMEAAPDSVASTTVSTESQPAKKASRKSATATAETSPTNVEPKASAPEPPAMVVVPKPAVPLFTASIAADLSSVVSYQMKGSAGKDPTVQKEFDQVVNTFGPAKFEAAEKGEWVYTRSSQPPQAATYVAVTNLSVTVTFKVSPTEQDLDRLTQPVLGLASALLGRQARGLWREGKGNGSTREFVLVQPDPPSAKK